MSDTHTLRSAEGVCAMKDCETTVPDDDGGVVTGQSRLGDVVVHYQAELCGVHFRLVRNTTPVGAYSLTAHR